jgi:hypothetical protein
MNQFRPEFSVNIFFKLSEGPTTRLLTLCTGLAHGEHATKNVNCTFEIKPKLQM